MPRSGLDAATFLLAAVFFLVVAATLRLVTFSWWWLRQHCGAWCASLR
jgi:hypothetical protein